MAEIEPRGSAPTGRIEYIDALRFIAALAVVAFHWLYNGIAGGKVTSLGDVPLSEFARYGSVGVAQFFVISGFVIGFSASRGSAGKFAGGRGVRLFPAFWVGVLVTSAVIALWGAPEFTVSPVQILANLTMVPQAFGSQPIDGVYWTLTLELMFYVATFFALFFGLRRWLPIIFPMWAIAMFLLAIVGFGGLPLAGGYFSYFAGGAIIDLIRRLGVTPLRLAGLVSAIGASALFTLERAGGWAVVVDEPTGFALRVALSTLCFGTVALSLLPAIAAIRIPGSRLMGAVTYPVYLLHAHIGYVILNSFATPQNVWWILAMMLGGLLVAAWLLHEIVEVRMARIWRASFGTVVTKPIDLLQEAARERLARPRKSSQPVPD